MDLSNRKNYYRIPNKRSKTINSWSKRTSNASSKCNKRLQKSPILQFSSTPKINNIIANKLIKPSLNSKPKMDHIVNWASQHFQVINNQLIDLLGSRSSTSLVPENLQFRSSSSLFPSSYSVETLNSPTISLASDATVMDVQDELKTIDFKPLCRPKTINNLECNKVESIRTKMHESQYGSKTSINSYLSPSTEIGKQMNQKTYSNIVKNLTPVNISKNILGSDLNSNHDSDINKKISYNNTPEFHLIHDPNSNYDSDIMKKISYNNTPEFHLTYDPNSNAQTAKNFFINTDGTLAENREKLLVTKNTDPNIKLSNFKIADFKNMSFNDYDPIKSRRKAGNLPSTNKLVIKGRESGLNYSSQSSILSNGSLDCDDGFESMAELSINQRIQELETDIKKKKVPTATLR